MMETVLLILVSVLLFGVTLFYLLSYFLLHRNLRWINKNLSHLMEGKYQEIELQSSNHKELKSIGVHLLKLAQTLQQKQDLLKQIVDKENTINHLQTGLEDSFTRTLFQLHKDLETARFEEQQRRMEEEKLNWATKGEALFGEILRNSSKNLDELSFQLMKNLVDYVGAIQGALFVINENTENEVFYELRGAIAYNRQKLIDKKFRVGESLVGRCAYEKLTVYLEEVPDHYVNITSGLGEANPKAILLIPAKIDDHVVGVIELASFNKFEPYKIRFLEKIGESIAAGINNMMVNENTKKLLEQSKYHSEELAAQGEELRQNLEELKATQEEVFRLREEESQRNEKTMQEVELHRKTLIKILDQIPSKIFLKDHEGRMLIVNKAVLKSHNNVKAEELLGKNDFDFIDDHDEAQKCYNDEQNIIKSGKPKQVLHLENINNSGVYLDSIKMPFYIDYLNEMGILGIQNNVTELVSLKEKVKEMEQQLVETTIKKY